MDEAERCSRVGYIHQSRLLVLGDADDLKQLAEVTPDGMHRLELIVPHPIEQLLEMRQIKGVEDATLFGETIHALVDDKLGHDDLLRQIDVPAEQAVIREIPPTLEDVFVMLTGQAERRHNAGEPPRPTRRLDEDRESETLIEPGIGEILKSPAPVPRRRRSDEGFSAIAVKEFAHIRRQPATLFFLLVVPVMQTIIFGFAIDMQIENIPTVVFDMDGRRHARELVERFVNTRKFTIIEYVFDQEQFRRAMTSGQARVGIRIPPKYSEALVLGRQAQVQVLVDGSDSQVAALMLAFIVMLPSVLLSGFMFPRSEMPTIIYMFTFAIPVTHFIEILRGIVLRGADAFDLTGPIVWLTICTLAILGLSVARFRKQLT